MTQDDIFYRTILALELRDFKEGKIVMTLEDAVSNYEVFNITTQVKNGKLIFGGDKE